MPSTSDEPASSPDSDADVVALAEGILSQAADEAAVGSSEEIEVRVLRSLRQIIQAVDVHSRRLTALHHITGPQLVCLLTLVTAGPLTTKTLARRVHLSSSTVVGVIDRLEKRGLVRRERDQRDRRLVNLYPTDLGRELAERAPSPLQESLAAGLAGLPQAERRAIAEALDRVVQLMGVEHPDAAPLIEAGPLDAEEPRPLG